MELPASLAPMRVALRLFQESLAVPLAVFVERLARVVGPMSGGDHEGGDPDGYGGLESRGPYERLLASEWLLLDTYPDEFMRRAAHREHLFTALNRSGARRPRTSVLFVDRGAAVLGAPRLGLLATVLCMQARAEAARCSFAWALADDPTLRTGLDEAGARHLLSASAGKPATVEGVLSFQRSLGARPGDELWLTGAGNLAEVADLAKVGSVLFEDVLLPDVCQVTARVRSPSGSPKVAQLDLPADDVSTRLLRGLFRPAGRIAPTRKESGRWVVFSQDEGRALIAHGGGVWRLTTVTKSNARARRYEVAAHRKLIAAGFRRQEPILASVNAGSIFLESPGSPPFAELPLDVAATQLDGPLGSVVPGYDDSFWVRLPGSAVFELCPMRKRVIRIATRSLVLSPLGRESGELACLGRDKTRDAQGGHVFQTYGQHRSSSVELPVRPARAFLGLTHRYKRGVLAVEVDDEGPIHLFEADRRWTLPRPGHPVVGVVESAVESDAPGLLVRDEEGLLGIGPTWTRRMFSTREAILHVVVAPSSWLAAVIFADDRVAFVRLPEGKIRAYFEGGRSVPSRVDA